MTLGGTPAQLGRPGDCGWVRVAGELHRGVVLALDDDGTPIVAYGTSKKHDDFGREAILEPHEPAGVLLRCTTTTYFYERTVTKAFLTELIAGRCPRGLWKKLRVVHDLA